MEASDESNGYTDSEVIWMSETSRWFTAKELTTASIQRMLNGKVSTERINRLANKARTGKEIESRPQIK